VLFHNFFLSGLSLVMLIALLYRLGQVFMNPNGNGVHDFFCDSQRRIATGPQIYWFYIFYLSKIL